jgi:hypothetical protein
MGIRKQKIVIVKVDPGLVFAPAAVSVLHLIYTPSFYEKFDGTFCRRTVRRERLRANGQDGTRRKSLRIQELNKPDVKKYFSSLRIQK